MALDKAEERGIVKVWVLMDSDWSLSLGLKLCKAKESTCSHAARSTGSLSELDIPTNRIGRPSLRCLSTDIVNSYSASSNSRFSQMTSLRVINDGVESLLRKA